MPHEGAGNKMSHGFDPSAQPAELETQNRFGRVSGAMIEKNELRLVELVAARISHDLVGPVGATVNGIELLSDGEAADPEVVRLIGQSARQASRRLQVFRAIYGTAGALPAGAPFAAASGLLAAMLEGEKVASAAWSGDPALEASAGRAGARVTLLAAFLLVEALPRGGEINVAAKQVDGTARIEVSGLGTGARFFEEVQSALAGKVPVDELTAKSAPAEILRRLAAGIGGQLGVASERDKLMISIVFPALGED